jgi:hypothetical protein
MDIRGSFDPISTTEQEELPSSSASVQPMNINNRSISDDGVEITLLK